MSSTRLYIVIYLTRQTVGRDKVLRTLQYFSRFLAWYLYRTNRPASTIAPFDATKKTFGQTRKLMRVGKFVEHFKAAAIASDAKSMDPVLRFTAIGRQLGYAFYMLCDNACVVRLDPCRTSLADTMIPLPSQY
jgi:peroxin-11B